MGRRRTSTYYDITIYNQEAIHSSTTNNNIMTTTTSFYDDDDYVRV